MVLTACSAALAKRSWVEVGCRVGRPLSEAQFLHLFGILTETLLGLGAGQGRGWRRGLCEVGGVG